MLMGSMKGNGLTNPSLVAERDLIHSALVRAKDFHSDILVKRMVDEYICMGPLAIVAFLTKCQEGRRLI